MQIPSAFQLLGQKITVEFDPALVNVSDCTGEAHYRFNKIKLQPIDGYVGRPQTKVEQTFCHELVHYLLYYGECETTKELYKNELVVERLGNLVHQALTTMEYTEQVA